MPALEEFKYLGVMFKRVVFGFGMERMQHRLAFNLRSNLWKLVELDQHASGFE